MKKFMFSALLFMGFASFALAQETVTTTTDNNMYHPATATAGETLKVRHWSFLAKGGMHLFRTTTRDIKEGHNYNGFTAGAALEYSFNPLFSMGIDWMYNKFNRPFISVTGVRSSWRSHTNDFNVYGSVNITNLAGKYRKSQKFNMYGKVGIGTFFRSCSAFGLPMATQEAYLVETDHEKNSLMMFGGFDAEYRLSRVLAFMVGFEYRYYFKKSLSGFKSGETYLYNNNNDRQFSANDSWNFIAGFRIKFGAKSKPHALNTSVSEYYPLPQPITTVVEKKIGSDVDLTPLNNKIKSLQDENAALKDRIGKLEAERKAIQDKVDMAIENLEFDFNSAKIRPSSYANLDKVASIMNNDSRWNLAILSGHTDSIGSDSYNQKLSERRCNSVKEYLINKGVAASRIETYAYGESQPIATNSTAEGRQRNRRVMIELK